MSKRRDKLVVIGWVCFVISTSILAVLWLQGKAFGETETKILTVGDLSCGHVSLQTKMAILDYLKHNKVNAFVFLGDLDYRNSYPRCQQAFFEQAQQYAPLKMVRGNHENNTLWALISKDLKQSNQVWTWQTGDTLLIGLNTYKPWQAYSKQYNDTLRALKDSNAEYKLVFMHKQPINACYSSNEASKDLCGFYELYQPIFKKYGVNCVIGAHLHKIALLERDGICYAIYGMGGATPYAETHFNDSLYESDLHGFAVIRVFDDHIEHLFKPNDAAPIIREVAIK